MTDIYFRLNNLRGTVQRFFVAKRLDSVHECHCACEKWPFHCGPCWVCGR